MKLALLFLLAACAAPTAETHAVRCECDCRRADLSIPPSVERFPPFQLNDNLLWPRDSVCLNGMLADGGYAMPRLKDGCMILVPD